MSRRFTGPLAVFAAVVFGLAAGCSASSPSSTPTPVEVETSGPAGPVPPGLQRFYGQPLSWGDCAPYASSDTGQQLFGGGHLQCARLTVPLDYQQPQGTTITIGVLRVKATDPARRIGSLLTNPGGPGASGMEAAAAMAPAWANSTLAKRFDLVGFDPRGIGASQPAVRCLTGLEMDRQRAADADDNASPQGVAAYQAQQQHYAAQCVSGTSDGKAMLAHVGTVDVARDLDVLRSALGDAKLSYLGYSYGTLLGATYAEQFPHNVRAMVLDGAVDPTESMIDQLVGQGAGFQTAFSQFAQWCAKQPNCPLGDSVDPDQATNAFHGLINPLLTHPVPVGDGRDLGYDDATTGVIQALYSQQFWPLLSQGLTELKQGSGRTLMLLADNYEGRNKDGSYSNEQDAFTAIRCVDSPPITDPTQLTQEQQRYKQAAPFLDNDQPPVAERDACAYWPVPPTNQPHLPSVSGLAPTLVISTTDDPATPYQGGVNLANALHGGLLTFQSTQHTAFLQNNSCVDKWGSGYLINLSLPPAGTRCS